MLRDVWRVARSRPGWTGMLLFCSRRSAPRRCSTTSRRWPPTTAPRDGMVAFVNGPVNGLVTAAGALIGGYLCDRMNRRAMYLLSGGLTAIVGIVMTFVAARRR